MKVKIVKYQIFGNLGKETTITLDSEEDLQFLIELLSVYSKNNKYKEKSQEWINGINAAINDNNN